MSKYEYSVGDKVLSPDVDGIKQIGLVIYADPIAGGVIRWEDGEETDCTWDQLGKFRPYYEWSIMKKRYGYA